MAILKETLDTKKHLMLKHIVVSCTLRNIVQFEPSFSNCLISNINICIVNLIVYHLPSTNGMF